MLEDIQSEELPGCAEYEAEMEYLASLSNTP